MFDFAVHAESVGYDAITIGHHHFQAGHPSDPLTLMAAIAARTETIGVGTGILPAAAPSPAAGGGAVATIDVLSGGRASIGVGLGWWDLEYETFDVPMSERGRRMEESLRIMRSAWEHGTFSWDGEFFQFPEVKVHPRPVTSPSGIDMSEIDELRGELHALAARVRELEDRIELTQLVAQYGPNVDSGSAEATAALGTDDGVFDAVGAITMLGREQIVDMVNGGGHRGLIESTRPTGRRGQTVAPVERPHRKSLGSPRRHEPSGSCFQAS